MRKALLWWRTPKISGVSSGRQLVPGKPRCAQEPSCGCAEGHARRLRIRSRAIREVLAGRWRPAARLVEVRGDGKDNGASGGGSGGGRCREAARGDVLRRED